MKEKRVSVIILLICVCLVGCVANDRKTSITETMVPQTEDNNSPQYGTVCIEQWNLLEGEMDEVIESIPMTKLDILDEIKQNYTKLEVPADKYDAPWVGGWHINLELMCAVGQTELGDIVLQPAEGNPLVLCIYDAEADQTQVFLKNALKEEGIATLALADFDIYLDGDAVSSDVIQELWSLHVAPAAFTAADIIEESGEEHSIRLIVRECTALQYEIKFYCCSKYLYIENIQRNQTICVPLDMLNLNFV